MLIPKSRILGYPLKLQDLVSVDPERYNSFQWMLKNDISGVLFETFSVETEKFGEIMTHDLKPGFFFHTLLFLFACMPACWFVGLLPLKFCISLNHGHNL